jgi:hypothetical protein
MVCISANVDHIGCGDFSTSVSGSDLLKRDIAAIVNGLVSWRVHSS